MDRKQLISSLQSSAADCHERTPFCPDDHDIAAFADGALDDSARVLIERHLPDCPACVSRVGLLARLMREGDANNTILASARIKRQTLPRWAVAATVVLAFAWPMWTAVEDNDGFRATRNIDSRLTQPEIIAPVSGVLASRAEFIVRWTDVPGSLYYEVRIVSDAGDLIGLQRVEVAEWEPGDQIVLQPGREYFIRVDAYLSDSQTIRSEHIPFRLKD